MVDHLCIVWGNKWHVIGYCEATYDLSSKSAPKGCTFVWNQTERSWCFYKYGLIFKLYVCVTYMQLSCRGRTSWPEAYVV